LLLSLLRPLLLSRTLLTLLLPTASSLLLWPFLTLWPLLTRRRSGLTLLRLLTLRLLTLSLRLSTSPISAAVIASTVTSPAALAERVTARADRRYESQGSHS
jgi:hypothetical protein